MGVFFPEIRVRLTILFTLVERRLDEGTRWPKGCLQPGSTQEGTVKPGRTRVFIENCPAMYRGDLFDQNQPGNQATPKKGQQNLAVQGNS